jgi:hypothetical protein
MSGIALTPGINLWRYYLGNGCLYILGQLLEMRVDTIQLGNNHGLVYVTLRGVYLCSLCDPFTTR